MSNKLQSVSASQRHMSNSTYDTMKFITQIVLPAVATLYFALAQIWGLPAAEQVVGTITAVDAFLGVILGISTNRYSNDDNNLGGVLTIDETDPEKTKADLRLSKYIEEFEDAENITVKIRKD